MPFEMIYRHPRVEATCMYGDRTKIYRMHREHGVAVTQTADVRFRAALIEYASEHAPNDEFRTTEQSIVTDDSDMVTEFIDWVAEKYLEDVAIKDLTFSVITGMSSTDWS